MTLGCRDGTVPASGTVLIEGQPAAGGRLSLSRIGGGARAFGAVASDGSFVLRTAEKQGVYPGAYRVFFRRHVDEQTRREIVREVAGQVAAEELVETFDGPSDTPLEIPESGSKELLLDIRSALGWTRHIVE